MPSGYMDLSSRIMSVSHMPLRNRILKNKYLDNTSCDVDDELLRAVCCSKL
jgi:hypothetical protein